jgi:hypothetical protein
MISDSSLMISEYLAMIPQGYKHKVPHNSVELIGSTSTERSPGVIFSG